MNNALAQALSIPATNGLISTARVSLAYRSIVLTTDFNTTNSSLSRKTHGSDVDVDVMKGLPAKEMENFCLLAELSREISARKKVNKHA